MAQPNAQALRADTDKSEDSSDVKYFKNQEFPMMRVVVGDPKTKEGEVAPQYVEFEPYLVLLKGVEGSTKIGYLKTSNGNAIKKCLADGVSVEIQRKEFEEATKEVIDEAGVQISGFRATR